MRLDSAPDPTREQRCDQNSKLHSSSSCSLTGRVPALRFCHHSILRGHSDYLDAWIRRSEELEKNVLDRVQLMETGWSDGAVRWWGPRTAEIVVARLSEPGR